MDLNVLICFYFNMISQKMDLIKQILKLSVAISKKLRQKLSYLKSKYFLKKNKQILKLPIITIENSNL